MAIQNSILAINELRLASFAKQGSDAVVGVLGQTMPEALSQAGRPLSPGQAEFEPTRPELASYRDFGKRIFRFASLPGNPVRSRIWRRSGSWATQTRFGITAGSPSVNRRGLSATHARHQHTSDHDYPSHDRRDDRLDARCGLALHTSGK